MDTTADTVRTVSRWHRWAMWFFALLLTVLFVWFGRFVLRDIDRIPRPNLSELQKEAIGKELSNEQARLQDEIEDLDRAIQAKQEQRASLKASTDESQTTMNQLMDIQSKSVEKNIAISDEERAYFAESQKIFLANQRQLQSIISQLQELRSQKRRKEYEREAVNERIDERKMAARETYNAAMKRRGRRILVLKLAFVLPLVVVGTWLFIKKRTTKAAYIIYAFDGAVLWLLITVIHEHFAFKYAKYIFLVAAIAVVVAILLYLIRAMVKPSRQWLLKRYEEAYRDGKCPVCQYPIQQGKLRYLLPAKRAFRRAAPVPVYEQAEPEPYTCPVCGARVFATCGQCGKIRHSLLEFCVHCSDRQAVFERGQT